MGDFSVKAVLSAVDRNFSSTMKSALGYTNNLKSTLTSGLGFGVLMGAGQAAFSAISGSVSGLAKETINTSDSMQKLQQAMRFSGSSEAEIQRIAGATGSLKTYADKTVFSLQDVMSTFGALSANGIKDADKMTESVGNAVAVFGGGAREFSAVGLAYSQAMAAGALHAQDWNQILNASPQLAGGLKKELIKLNPILGEDFKGAMEDGAITADLLGQAMNNIGMTDLAKDAAQSVTTFEGAMGNLEATAQSGMMKLYDTFAKSSVVDAINGLNDKVGAGFDWLAETIPKAIDKISPYWEVLKTNASDVGKAFGDAFGAIGDAFKKIIGVYDAKDAIEKFTNIVEWAKGKLVSFAGFLKDHADTIASVIKALPKLFLAYKGFKMLKGIVSFGFAASDALDRLSGKSNDLGKAGKNGRKGTMTLKKGLGSLAKSAGIALIIASLAGLALAIKPLASLGTTAVAPLLAFGAAVGGLAVVFSKTGKQLQKSSKGIAIFAGALSAMALAMTPLASLGTTAIAPLVTFGVVVGGLAAVFANTGKQLQKSSTGIIVFAAAVSVMALAMTPLAATGTEGAVAMATFGIVVAGLVAVFGVFGSALNAAIPGMLAFGATILMVGAGMSLASVFINALTPFVKQLGDTFSQVADAISGAVSRIVTVVGDTLCNVMTTAGDVISKVVDSISEGFKTIADGISGVIDSISGGFSSVLDSIAAVIESIGNSAKNAGDGFKSVAEGISMIAELSIIDIAKSLGAVATGLGEMAGKGEGLQQAASGMAGISDSITSAASATASLNSLLNQLSSMAIIASASILSITAAFSGLKIPSLDVSPILAAFAAVTVSASIMSKQVITSGQRAGDGFTRSFSSSARQSISVANSISISVIDSLNSAAAGAYNCGYYIGIGLANGMRTTLGEVQAVATQLAAAAEQAVIAKSKIGSPSRVFKKLGAFLGEGFAIGIDSMSRQVKQASEDMVNIPSVPSFSGVHHGLLSGRNSLDSNYTYNPTVYVTTEVKSILEGKEVGRGSAPYVKAENERKDKIRKYVKGIR
ncbi:hypothetical protein GCM10008922_45390 [Faecalicatena contorta]|uniref:tape measure protein n=1 Tax=Faecalicatena contorta TaxID=39482 RepID=UPI002921CA98|nr:tape measure protein [Muricomes sp.]CAJ1887617.1 tail protein [uncultured phage]